MRRAMRGAVAIRLPHDTRGGGVAIRDRAPTRRRSRPPACRRMGVATQLAPERPLFGSASSYRRASRFCESDDPGPPALRCRRRGAGASVRSLDEARRVGPVARARPDHEREIVLGGSTVTIASTLRRHSTTREGRVEGVLFMRGSSRRPSPRPPARTSRGSLPAPTVFTDALASGRESSNSAAPPPWVPVASSIRRTPSKRTARSGFG